MAARPPRGVSRLVRSADQRPSSISSSARARLFDRIVVAILRNAGEAAAVQRWTSASAMLREVFAGRPNVEVDDVRRACSSTTRARKARRSIVRGVRSAADFDYERQMALMNRHLDPTSTPCFLMPSERVRVHQLDAGPGNRRARRLGARPRAAGRLKPRLDAAGATRSKDAQRMTHDTLRLADRMQHIGMSPTMKGTMEAERLRRAGRRRRRSRRGRAGLSDAGARHGGRARGARQQFTKYTANPGILDLREAVGRALPAGLRRRRTGRTKSIITAGGKQALFHAALALFGPGDEVITHAPGWPTHRRADQAGRRDAGRSCATRAEDGFALTADAFLAAVTPRTRGIVINSPGNPTGALLSEAEARDARGRGRAARGLWVVIDLCYEQLDLRQRAAQPAADLRRRRCAIGSCCADPRRRPTR